jgi:hypothetical protein
MNESITVKDAMKNFFRVTNDVVIAKNYGMATNALDSSIHSKKGDLFDAQQEVKDAKEQLISVTHPITAINNRAAYIATMINAKHLLAQAEEKVETIEFTIKFLEGQRAEFEKVESSVE